MTIATDRGFVVGQSYRFKADHEYYPHRSAVFRRDDGTDLPAFDVDRDIDSDGWTYLNLDNFESPTVGGPVTFEEQAVEAYRTSITIHRRLTQAEREAIQRIVGA